MSENQWNKFFSHYQQPFPFPKKFKVFCDSLSMVNISSGEKWVLHQYAKHFPYCPIRQLQLLLWVIWEFLLAIFQGFPSNWDNLQHILSSYVFLVKHQHVGSWINHPHLYRIVFFLLQVFLFYSIKVLASY